MPRPFAEYYDLVYCDKNYDADVAAVLALSGGEPGHFRMLELGAGTGNHSLILAPKTRELVSVEIDADFAAIAARKFAAAAIPNLRLESRPLAALPLAPFDAACALFHVLNYVSAGEMQDLARGLAQRLKPGSRFITDLWNGAAALIDPPHTETREKRSGDTLIRQTIAPELRPALEQVSLAYDIEISGPAVSTRFQEVLQLHLWTMPALTDQFARAGFGDISFYDYARFPASASADSWRLWMVAERA